MTQEALVERLREGHCAPHAGCNALTQCACVALGDAAARIEALEGENARLREGLKFYANPQIYKMHPHGLGFDDRDLSYSARAVLAAAERAKS